MNNSKDLVENYNFLILWLLSILIVFISVIL